MNRRHWIQTLLLGACAGPIRVRAAKRGEPKIAMIAGGLDEDTLRFTAQLGVDWVDLGVRPKTLFPPPGQVPRGAAAAFNEEELLKQKRLVESFGLKIGIRPLPAFPNVILGNADRDRDIEAVKRSIGLAGKLGIPALEYNFILYRASEGYTRAEGRGGAGLRAFNLDAVKDRSRVPGLPAATREQLWERLHHFLRSVIPAAEQAGVRLALHPNDPPVESFRGALMPVRSVDDLKRVIDLVSSPSNGITFDTGVTRETGADVLDAIRYFGSRDRINHVHFRNVRMHAPFNRYTESFSDDGDVDMEAAMRALVETGYSRLMVPDHSPQLAIDREGHFAGWAYAIGYMKALRRAALR